MNMPLKNGCQNPAHEQSCYYLFYFLRQKLLKDKRMICWVYVFAFNMQRQMIIWQHVLSAQMIMNFVYPKAAVLSCENTSPVTHQTLTNAKDVLMFWGEPDAIMGASRFTLKQLQYCSTTKILQQ